jgi:hypothetical protein
MCVGRQIKVLGSYWKGRVSNEEVNSLYLCTVRDHHTLYKWDAGGTPSQAMELQEITGTSDVSPPSVGVHTDMSGESSSADTQSKFPHLAPSKVVVFKYWTLVSDDLIPHVRKSGQYTATFKCNIEVAGKVCGPEQSLIHCKNYVNVYGEKQKMYTFTESFTHHVDLLWAHGGVLSWNMTQSNEDFQHYVRGYEPRAKFPSMRVQERLHEVVLQLHLLERKKHITSLEKQFQVKACIGLQLELDMWTNTDSVEGEQYACVIMTTVVEPMDTTTPGAQLHLHRDIVDFMCFRTLRRRPRCHGIDNDQQARVQALRQRYHGQVL